MSVPGPLPPPGAGGARGPLGARAFRAGVVLCAVAIAGGLAMLLLARGAVASAGTALLALGVVGAVSVGFGMLAERLAERRRGPPPSGR